MRLPVMKHQNVDSRNKLSSLSWASPALALYSLYIYIYIYIVASSCIWAIFSPVKISNPLVNRNLIPTVRSYGQQKFRETFIIFIFAISCSKVCFRDEKSSSIRPPARLASLTLPASSLQRQLSASFRPPIKIILS